VARATQGGQKVGRFRAVAQTLTYNADPGIVAGDGIGAALRAIAGASRMAAAAERAGIMCDFANRMAAARATARPQELAGILRTIKEQRGAALAMAARNAQRESTEKRQAVLQGGQAQRPKPGGRRRPRRHGRQ
jgi:hypothetical protein